MYLVKLLKYEWKLYKEIFRCGLYLLKEILYRKNFIIVLRYFLF